ncbi:MFS transporter [Bifidobacterium gallicum]|uniref:MFS transporter n=1 Tax=Bifidobacterium gallicum DSM 20093 = LMG 11596 TaxID=561180 RepID=D1NRV4_9BIFI|nr:MFS transporter [Bifidobacterium gallicum]EFA23406.1 transporter, major facilitator family protein [Bifidobacterium gallicum DSM 20093 = LMG 11596]KFI57294.1 MFS transporter [Bifidobacterium gallicum DSM 20093 = LMG 11596]
MTMALLAVIYLAFISLGLPDSLLGAAWPAMGPALDVPVSWAGGISMTISAGTIVSALLSERTTLRFGAGPVTAVSTIISAASLIGFSLAPNYWWLIALAIPFGLGAGAIDAALNNYVAVHYQSRHMNWLHSMWGVGALIGPYVMGYAISSGHGWASGYRWIGFIQFAIAALLLVSLPLWAAVRRHQRKQDAARLAQVANATDAVSDAVEPGVGATPGTASSSSSASGSATPDAQPDAATPLGLRAAFRITGVPEILCMFFCYCSLEQTCMLWSATYLNQGKGLDAAFAAGMASLFFIGMTAGRFLSGFIAMRFNDPTMIRAGQVLIVVGIVLLLLPIDAQWCALAAFIVLGLGCAPIYPSVIHSTPVYFGVRNSQAIVGMQMAFAYTGSMLCPALFGLLAQYVSVLLLPWYLVLFLVMMVIMHRRLRRLHPDAFARSL